MNKTITPNEKITDVYKEYYIAYTRKSTDDSENQKNSIEYQELEIVKDLARQGISVAPITIDGFCKDGFITEHHSGSKEDSDFTTNPDGTISISVNRPKFLMLVNLLRQKKFKGVISLCWDRFSRNEADDMLTKKLLKQGVDIRFVQAKYEATSAGALHMDIDGMFSRHYSRALGEKVRDTNRKLRADGKCLYTPPLGYLSEGSGSKPLDPERAILVKRLFEMYATGEWSFSTLAAWANRNGLTNKPARRKRTKEERMQGVELADIPKVCRPISESTIWHILSNPFYIGKLIYKDEIIDSKAHQPLIDLATYYKVQAVLRDKAVKIHYPHFEFFTYRGLVKCGSCTNVFSPYKKKGITYYRSRCKKGCGSKLKNINDKFITTKVQEILDRIHFTEHELLRIEQHAWKEFNQLNESRSKEVEDIRFQRNKALENLEFLTNDKLNLLRTGVFTTAQMIEEEGRLQSLLKNYEEKISRFSVSTKAILEYVISFSELARHAASYFEYCLDSEKRDLVIQVFSELYIEDGELKYEAKQAYNLLLKRHNTSNTLSCGEDYVFLELIKIYEFAKTNKPILEAIINHSALARAA